MTNRLPAFLRQAAARVLRGRQIHWSGETGFSLIELLIVMVILGIVIGGLTTIFVSASSAELTLNRRFQAQGQARLALDKIRSDVHCASGAEAQTISTYAGVKLAISSCSASTPTISWCAVPVSASPPRYQLYRSTSTTAGVICTASDATRVLVADYLTTNSNVFTTPTIPQFALQSVGVDFRVSVNPATSKNAYELTDAIDALNSTRCATSLGCPAPTVS
jgi:prepilin-type N-terminal cleavage/methylation domain-containing protein